MCRVYCPGVVTPNKVTPETIPFRSLSRLYGCHEVALYTLSSGTVHIVATFVFKAIDHKSCL